MAILYANGTSAASSSAAASEVRYAVYLDGRSSHALKEAFAPAINDTNHTCLANENLFMRISASNIKNGDMQTALRAVNNGTVNATMSGNRTKTAIQATVAAKGVIAEHYIDKKTSQKKVGGLSIAVAHCHTEYSKKIKLGGEPLPLHFNKICEMTFGEDGTPHPSNCVDA